MVKAIIAHLSAFDHPFILLEDYGGLTFANTAIPLIELGSLLRSAFLLAEHERGAIVDFVSPSELKKFATGKGNAAKPLVMGAARTQFKVDFGKEDDLYDAYILARMACASFHPDPLLSDEQYAVLKKTEIFQVGALTQKK